ncbi:unnamed protein product [Acanthoscelides obtectus]|uniref:MSP domain-containing protein n=3 Tax=Acanthoscelides obtectus TaxID=200917 RepID=A0A9P0M6J6_ACAOB|nr:unnamed protein product [Acanthoscelides obtectus]CAK1619806.1 Cilia- and flagella-associated protein 65 [Acanthoscelides obtectus]
MDGPCDCQEYSNEPILPKNHSAAQVQLKTVDIDFGKVPVYGKYYETITKDVQSEEPLNYGITEEPEIIPIYQVFTFNKRRGKIPRKGTLKLKICYYPILPQRMDFNTFVVSIDGRRAFKVNCKGLSIAPVLRVSCRELSFVTWPQGGLRKKMFELKNVSEVPAEFQFDCDRLPKVFKVEPRNGVIQPNKHIFVAVRYLPTTPGIFSQQLHCLVLGSEPLTCDLIGLHGKGQINEKEINLKSYNYDFEYKVSYGAYFREYKSIKRTPHVYLDRPFIDFGRIGPSKEKATYQIVNIRNGLDGYIEITWPKEKGVFMVKPQRLQIPPGHSGLLQCWFEPDEEYTMFNKTITGQVDWKMVYDDPDPLSYCVPMNISITLQGNSYPEGEYPICRVEIIPDMIKFPPCLPGSVSHQNFKIQNGGHMSAMFRLVAPEDSKIIVKPALGVVKDFTIVTAQYTADECCQGVCAETWELELNGDTRKRRALKFMVTVGLPIVRVGDSDFIRFDTSPPGTTVTLQAPLRNLSCFYINYQLASHPCLTADIESGELNPNDQVMITFKCKADLYNKKNSTATFNLQVIEKVQQHVGIVYPHEFVVYTDCAPVDLCAVPNSYDFGDLRFASEIKTEFHLFNFGQCSVQYKLSCHHHSNTSDTYSLEPSNGKVEVKGMVKVVVSSPRIGTPGQNVVSVSYDIKEQEDLGGGRAVFTFRYKCIYPKLQVIDILDYTFGHLFGKDYFWRTLRITRLNEELKSIKENETKVLDVHLPDCEVGENVFSVVLLIANVTQFDVDVSLKRIKLCDCVQKQVQTSINKTKLDYDCPHREMLTMKLQETIIYGNTRRYLIVTAKYTVIGDNKLAYSLDIGDNRRIEFFFNMKVLPEDGPKVSFYSHANNTFRMVPIYIGRKHPPVQTFWLYNNTKESTRYKANLTYVDEMCEKEGFPVLKMLNPCGAIEPYSSVPLLFKFHPIRAVAHTVKVPLILEEEQRSLVVIGVGKNTKIKRPFIERGPETTSAYYNLPVLLSQNYIRINPMLTWSVQTRMIFIKNCSKDIIYQFDFPDQTIYEVIKITATPTFGFLKPKETQTIMISVRSYNEPAILNYNYTCYIMNYNALFLHRRRLTPDKIVLSDSIHSQLQHYTISLSVCINIVDQSDDVILEAKQFFSCFPPREMKRNTSPIATDVANIELSTYIKDLQIDGTLLKNILERIISDTVFHKKFSSIAKITSKTKTGDYYIQYRSTHRKKSERTLDKRLDEDKDRQREEEIAKFLARPSFTTLAGTLHNMLTDGLHETFKLDTQFSSGSDHHIIDKDVYAFLKKI